MTEAGFLETLERVEAVHSILKRMEDIDCVLDKITVIEEFISRFGHPGGIDYQFEEVEQQLYILKEVFNVEEAAKYLNISTGHLYRLTSTHEIPFSKPNGKQYLLRAESVGRLENAGIRYCPTGRLNGRRLLQESARGVATH